MVDHPIRVERILASRAKVLCSAIWVSGRDATEALENSVFHATPQGLRELIDVDIDRARKTVTLTMKFDVEGATRLVAAYRKMHPSFEADWEREIERLAQVSLVSRSAQYFGDQGCVILPMDGSGIKFEPVAVESTLPDPESQDWPMGDRLPEPPEG